MALSEAIATLVDGARCSPIPSGEKLLDIVEDAAEAVGCRARRVLLDPGWWREPGVRLLARVDDDDAPLDSGWVALLPRSWRGYRIVGLEGPGTPRIVDAAVAARLAPFAYSLEERFPSRPLGVVDVLRLALAPLRADLALLLLVSLAAALAGLVVPVATGALIDRAIPAGSERLVFALVAGVAAAGLAAIALGMLRSIASLRIEARAGVRLQAALLDRVMRAPARFFRGFASGDLALRLAAVGTVQRTLTHAAIGAAIASVFALANTALLFSYSAPLAWSALGIATVTVAISALIGIARVRIGRRITQAEGTLSATTVEMFSGIAKLRAAAAEDRAHARWLLRYREWRRLGRRGAELANLELALLSLLQPLALVAVLALAWRLAETGSANALNVGDFVAFQSALFGTLAGVASLVSLAFSVASITPEWERARPLLAIEPEGADPTRRRHVPEGAVHLEQVSFAYPGGPPVLSDISLDVPAGAFVAIVGASGSGKSTLLRLLLGFETPDRGVIRYDGIDLATLDLTRLRRGIGTVLQGGKLWAGDILTNIAGSHPLTVEEALQVARKAGLESDIEAMPMGLYTLVGEGVSTLSGGQSQRVLIARALAGNPKLLLLDEATSALDNLSQAAVLAALAALKATRIVVAHRLSTIRNADQIIVLEDGRIAQQGTYRELAEAPGPFAAMLAQQGA